VIKQGNQQQLFDQQQEVVVDDLFSCKLIVDDIFEPVTWHHQRRPFIRALICKTIKTR
jgi:hypothetical protein